MFHRFLTKARLRLMEILSRRRARGGIYYIGGPDVLPQPLSREEEGKYEFGFCLCRSG